MSTTTASEVSATMALATAAAVSPTMALAIAMATSLDEIRQFYGDDCANFVIATWRASSNPRWEDVTYNALKRWIETHPRPPLDLNS